MWRTLVGPSDKGSGRLRAVADTKFGQDRADVVASRFGRDAQGRRDVGIAMADGQQLEHFALAAGEPMRIGAGVGTASTSRLTAQCRQALTGPFRCRPGAQVAERFQRGFDGGRVAAE